MADRSPQFDLARKSNDRLSGASDTWDEGAAGAILTSEAFESADSGSAEFSLSAAESSDTASVVMGASVVLAASEQPDTITASLVQGANLALSASEGSDAAAMSLSLASVGLALAATEGSDTAAAVMGDGLALAASEQSDTAAITLAAGVAPAVDINLAASEGSDSASIDMLGERRQGGVSRKRVPVVDIIWPDDPRHPNNVTALPAPVAKSTNVIRVPRPASAPVAALPAAESERPNYDTEIALLLLAA